MNQRSKRISTTIQRICMVRLHLSNVMIILALLTLPMLMVTVVNGQDLHNQLNQRKKCTQYGHSCLGGHGKRSAVSSSSSSSQLFSQQPSSLLSSSENNFPLIQQLQQQKHLKPLSIPLYIYRNNFNHQQQQQESPPATTTTKSMTNNGNDDGDGRSQTASLARLAFLEHLLNMDNNNNNNNNNEFDQQQTNEQLSSLLIGSSILERLRAQQQRQHSTTTTIMEWIGNKKFGVIL
ncbi:hypothetical protein DERF_011730 [Dermatophagoides farinae]|uniref:Uncharacterized protein n=1 Tax=Dermatophagoides farinae TaxID=6954 RepID=A0A922L3D2_DERFA|nr:hypothetical protein DERF_011730 [Dermatophagoides farinae]